MLNKRRMFTLLLALWLVLVLSTAVLAATEAGYDLTWWTVDGGGGSAAGGGYSLSGTVGQPDSGVMSGGGYEIVGGYWNQTVSGSLSTIVYLPILTR